MKLVNREGVGIGMLLQCNGFEIGGALGRAAYG